MMFPSTKKVNKVEQVGRLSRADWEFRWECISFKMQLDLEWRS